PGERAVVRVRNAEQRRLVSEFGVDTLDATDVATELSIALQQGSSDAVAALSTPEASGQAEALGGAAAAPWQLDTCEGAAGSAYCTFTADGAELVVRVGQVEQPPLVTEITVQGA
ncbi:MAG: hypothetical protein S0880_05685, partial [Actinomycetota bacterium]|nr:hypothetical protein [Actinomycetota bacterium]